jgi:pyruvate kinase
MNYDIVATLGPSSNTPAIWQGMLDAGVSAFRLNTSHLSLTQLQHWLDQLTPFLVAHVPVPALALDLQGSKWRLGDFSARTVEPDEAIELVYASTSDRPNTLPVPHLDFFQAAPVSSSEIVLNDAKIKLVREAIGPGRVRARVIIGGELSARKGITFAASEYRQENLSDKDRASLEQTRHLPFVRYAISYLRDAAEVHKYRTHFGSSAYLIAKLERPAAMDEALQIAKIADELWVCRGDLGAELGPRSMAEAVRRFSNSIGDLAIPALMAGQVLEHMTEHPTPTRSEVCYLHDVLRDGYRGVVLSDEAAIGRYPIESCRTAALFRDN